MGSEMCIRDRWKGDYAVAVLADFQAGVAKPQVHTIREVKATKRDGKFVFPLKERYETLRNKITVQATESDSATELDGEEILDARAPTPFDVPTKLRSRTNKNKTCQKPNRRARPMVVKTLSNLKKNFLHLKLLLTLLLDQQQPSELQLEIIVVASDRQIFQELCGNHFHKRREILLQKDMKRPVLDGKLWSPAL